MTHRLSTSEFQVIWEQQRLGAMPAPLRVLPDGFTEQERRAVINQAHAGLRRNKLIDRHGEVDQRFGDLLHLLARPAKAVDARLSLDRDYKVWAAGTATRGALGWQDGETVTVRAMPAAGIAGQVVSLLPQAGAGYGRSVSVRLAVLREACGHAGQDPRQLEMELQRAGVSRADAHHLVTMTAGAGRRGQFRVLTDERGKLSAKPHVIGWWITDQGLYLAQDHTASDGQNWRTVAPADHARLAGQIERMLSDAR
jgi:hypothetical protein